MAPIMRWRKGTHHGLLLAAVVALTGCAGVKDTTRTFNTVVIDAGHGGHDSGARSRQGVPEKHLALDVAQRLDARLREAGFRTVMTRTGDQFIPLDRRVGISNAQTNALFVSVHFNSARRASARGTETFYHHRVARNVARRIENRLSTIPGVISRGAKHADFRVLRKAHFPAVLVECGFLSNRWEAARCASPAYRDLVAERIAQALVMQRFGTGPRSIPRLAAVRAAGEGGGG